MSQLPSTVALQQFRSWFDNTRYSRRATLEEMMLDPIYTIIGEDTSFNLSDTLSTMGMDSSSIAKAKVPGGRITKDAPIELDPHSVNYITFVKEKDWQWESILHDQYRLHDEDGASVIRSLWEAVGLFLTNCLWNENDQTAFDVAAHEGVISYATGTPDGQPIISASHSGPGYSGKTNIGGTGPLSGPNMVTNIDVGKSNATRGSGLPAIYRADQVWIGDVEVMTETARQITGSQLVATSNNNAVNIYSDGSKQVVNFKYAPRNSVTGTRSTTATDLYKWATADSRRAKAFCRYKWIARPQIITEINIDDENLDARVVAACRLAFICDDPFFMVENQASVAPNSAW